MNEAFIQFVWEIGIFDQNELKTTDGESIQIYYGGQLNTSSGPDFSQAHIRIDETDWFGNVEIHIQSEDWNKHGHQHDPAYNNVILHVVLKENVICFRADGSRLPCVEIASRISESIWANYQELHFNLNAIPCKEKLKFVSQPIITSALDRALVERLERKSHWMEEWLKNSDGDWMTVFMAALVRSFGFGTNGDAFELLALNLPILEICRSENNAFKILAITYGIAGFLEESPNDGYQAKLRQEWLFQQKRLGLNHLDKSAFKFMRMRPGNFPSIRLAQLSSLLTDFQRLFKILLQEPNIPNMLRILGTEIDSYWHTHYHFGKKSTKHIYTLSLSSRQTIIINAFVPFLFEFGKFNIDQSMMENALDILRKLPPEDNKIIRDWSDSGIDCTSAFDSQALLELRHYYCDKRRCLNCAIGASLIRLS